MNAENRLKFFVVGESSGDPDKWDGWGNRAIVLAHDAKEALSLTDFSNQAAEIKMDKAVLLLSTEGRDSQD